MKLIEEIGEMKAAARTARAGGRVVLVPTMGALHRGHVELVKLARRSGSTVVLSIFVNPAQFAPGEDYDAYPRDLDADMRIARAEGVDIVFHPSPEAMYPEGFDTTVEVKGLSEHLCGLSRPGHFRGVATVVLKLFNITMPHAAVFGSKDYQQLLIIKRMTDDLNLDVEIIEAPTVREPDGLAVSSRNRYLSKEEREAAGAIPRALRWAEGAFKGGLRRAHEIEQGVRKILEAEGMLEVEYVEVCDPENLEGLDIIEESALVAIAARAGKARLIDNVLLQKTDDRRKNML